MGILGLTDVESSGVEGGVSVRMRVSVYQIGGELPITFLILNR